MGNWRTVQIIGTCSSKDVPNLREHLTVDNDYSNFHCLSSTGGICGLPNWAREHFDVIGNLAERDYSPEDVAEQLEKMVQDVPSLTVKVHCGGDYEDKKCVATVTVADGKVTIGDPEIEEVPEISQEQMKANLYSALMR